MIKVALLGMAAVFLALPFKTTKPEYGTGITLAVCILILLLGVNKLELIMTGIEKIQSYLSFGEGYIKLLLKIVGITYVAELASELCRDAGYATVANQVEMVGRLTILSMSMPVLLSLLDTIHEFLA
jgi:stage III sporulation protein AD